MDWRKITSLSEARFKEISGQSKSMVYQSIVHRQRVNFIAKDGNDLEGGILAKASLNNRFVQPL